MPFFDQAHLTFDKRTWVRPGLAAKQLHIQSNNHSDSLSHLIIIIIDNLEQGWATSMTDGARGGGTEDVHFLTRCDKNDIFNKD